MKQFILEVDGWGLIHITKQELIQKASDFTENSDGNYVNKEIALSPELAGMRMFDEPVLAFGSAEDPYFQNLKAPHVVGSHFRLPVEWLSNAKTVIAFFLPFSEAVKEGNKRAMDLPSGEWLHARVEGQAFVATLSQYIKTELINAGYESVVPPTEGKFFAQNSLFTSNWSERHVAFVCGLGTFGLSKGLITQRGVAGRFGSVITSLDLPADARAYTEVYEYCNMCGKCAVNCPARAISIEKGKLHQPCMEFVEYTKTLYDPWFGCGKCQVHVPCENRPPQSPHNRRSVG